MFGKWFRRKAPNSPQGPSFADVPKIIQTYGKVLEDSAGGFADVTMLPLPKEQMMVVLKLAWVVETDAKRKEQLEAGFMFLSDFREDIGPVPIRRGLSTDMAFLMSPEGRAKVKTVAELGSAAFAESTELLAEFGAFKADISDGG
jgi:hypothetical protein